MEHVIALDVGGTGMKAALVGAGGELLCEVRRPTEPERGPEAVVTGILTLAADLRAEGVRRYGTTASACGVAVPGVVDAARGVARYAANLGWRDVPLRDLLGARLDGVPVAVGHDMRAGGLAEGRIGAGSGAGRFLFVGLGTGISGAVGIDGRVEAGAHGGAGEIGHVVVRPGGLPCPCGQRGCLERYASAAAVGRAWALASGDPDADAAACAAAVVRGDPRARQVWQDAVDTLADGLITAHTLLDPNVLIIGGGLARAGDTLCVPLRKAVARRITFQTPPEVVPAALGDTAGCLGAGLLAWDLVQGLVRDPVADGSIARPVPHTRPGPPPGSPPGASHDAPPPTSAPAPTSPHAPTPAPTSAPAPSPTPNSPEVSPR